MGGRSRSQTVGYRYSLGMPLALCHGPVDTIREIRVDGRSAWSVAAGSAQAGMGAGVETRIGAVAVLTVTPAQPGEAGATVSFPGTLAGVRIGPDYRLALAGGSAQTIRLLAVGYDAPTGITRWTVAPDAFGLAAQTVEVFEAAETIATEGATEGATGGRIRINTPKLIGGESREGGITDDINVLMGGPQQGPNNTLAARMRGAGMPRASPRSSFTARGQPVPDIVQMRAAPGRRARRIHK